MRPIFLTAEWRNLLMLNYLVEPSVLEPLVPGGTGARLVVARSPQQREAVRVHQHVHGIAIQPANGRTPDKLFEAADRAMQVHGGLGYSRHKPFEHIYRHHRRYRITEGAEEIQMRRVAGYMFGFMKQRAPKGVDEAGSRAP